jgi:acyl carrier protein
MGSVSQRVRDVVAIHGKIVMDLAKITDSDNLYDAGMTSHASVNLMLALEDEFDVEFLDSQLRRSSFQSIESIAQVLSELGVDNSS